jgi:hypothetical protein
MLDKPKGRVHNQAYVQLNDTLRWAARTASHCIASRESPNNKALHAEPPIARFLKSKSLAAAGRTPPFAGRVACPNDQHEMSNA